jgi:hypothetical protein
MEDDAVLNAFETINVLSNLSKSPPIRVPHVINVGYLPSVPGATNS